MNYEKHHIYEVTNSSQVTLGALALAAVCRNGAAKTYLSYKWAVIAVRMKALGVSACTKKKTANDRLFGAKEKELELPVKKLNQGGRGKGVRGMGARVGLDEMGTGKLFIGGLSRSGHG